MKEASPRDPIISVSGLRGVIGQSLTPDVVTRYVAAFADQIEPGPILVSRDGRTTGHLVRQFVVGGLLACGREVLDAGIAATPTLGVLVRTHQAAGGVQISASHNPPQYNGLKLFDGDGRVVPQPRGERILAAYRDNSPQWVAHDAVGRCETLAGAAPADSHPHLDRVLATIDAERIRARRFRVVLDANHGAGSVLGRRLLDDLGCETLVLGGEPDGQFDHPPEPTRQNLDSVRSAIGEFRADVGFCQDPDADRLAVIDERAEYIGEEYTLALCVDHVLGQAASAGRVVVTNCATSQMIDDICRRHGNRLIRSAVGEANVVHEMIAGNAVFGGEGNGGPIDPRVGWVRDSLVGMALILDSLAHREQSVSRRVAELPAYAIHKTQIPLPPADVANAYHKLAAGMPDARADRTDGLRLDWPGRWLLLRPSNTEPIVRLIAEAASQDEAVAICQRAEQLLVE